MDTTEGSRPLDIRRLSRARLLKPGRWFSWQWLIGGRPVSSIQVQVETERVLLVYQCRRGRVWQEIEQSILIKSTLCNYGGSRPWWCCPSCGRRVAVLYSPGQPFACRHCHRLAYASQREEIGDRALRQSQKIRKRLGGTANMMELFPLKPKGMHWRTYDRLFFKALKHQKVSLEEIARWLGLKAQG